MAKARTWLWIFVGFVGVCVLGLFLVAGAGIYFVSHHIAVRPTTSSSALRAIDEARAVFKAQGPLLELDSFEHPHESRPIADLPTSPIRPTNLYVLAWNPVE